MTNIEFSNQFDVLYNNITSDQAPGLNEYEKSVFLTKAQSQLVNEYFNIRTDGVGGGFDGNQRRQYDFSSLIVTTHLTDTTTSWDQSKKIDKRSRVYFFPADYFLSVNEIISDERYQYAVIPISYSEYQRLMLKPYNFPVKRGVWRLLTYNQSVPETVTSVVDSETVTETVYVKKAVAEIIGKFVGSQAPSYQLRYVKALKPIILDDLTNYGDDLTISSETAATECELPPESHEEILERAVTLAKIAWQGGTGTQAAAQQRSNNE